MISGAVAMWKALPIAQRRMIVALLCAIGLANIAQPIPISHRSSMARRSR